MKYYTVIVVKIDAFESQIINERHFGNYEDAEEFSRNVFALDSPSAWFPMRFSWTLAYIACFILLLA